MRHKNTLLFLFSVGMLLCSLSACSAQTDANQVADEASPDGDSQVAHTHADLEQGVTLRDVTEQLAAADVTSFTARIAYTEHETYLQVDEALGGIEQALAAERARLVFLRDQFSENDSLEAPVKEHFTLDIETINVTADLSVLWVEYAGDQVNLDGLAVQQTAVETPDMEAATPNPDKIGTVRQALTDYPNDQIFTPAGGTSTIYTSGTLQKFWLDTNAKNAINYYKDGLEMDTVITPASGTTCSGSGVSSNLPLYYADTQTFDSGAKRNCSVGSVSGESLQTWYLYWTWHPFQSFNTSAHIDVQYQPKSWCFWVLSSVACYANKPWCMCAHRTYPATSWLISYDYSEAPGVEKSWVKN